jgi:hypothetical protein
MLYNYQRYEFEQKNLYFHQQINPHIIKIFVKDNQYCF